MNKAQEEEKKKWGALLKEITNKLEELRNKYDDARSKYYEQKPKIEEEIERLKEEYGKIARKSCEEINTLDEKLTLLQKELAYKKGECDGASVRVSYANGQVNDLTSALNTLKNRIENLQGQLANASDSRKELWVNTNWCGWNRYEYYKDVYTGDKSRIIDTVNTFNSYSSNTANELQNKVKKILLTQECKDLVERTERAKKELYEKQAQLYKEIKEKRQEKENYLSELKKSKLMTYETKYYETKREFHSYEQYFKKTIKENVREEYAEELLDLTHKMIGMTVFFQLVIDAMRSSVLEMAERRASAKLTLKDALSELGLMVYYAPLQKEGFENLNDFQCSIELFKQEILPLIGGVVSTKAEKLKLLGLSENAQKYCQKQKSIVLNQMPALNVFFFNMYQKLEHCGKKLLDNASGSTKKQ
ncbi:viral A-type inclusion protein [Reticulomyxa filosa]|uniref:Viral A-type inclusion protein n=1 Tax=Reticulomyxa filosa TaxID=46433 RepID=X6LM48_RETFI|nr:viral A-type inclusion protein [Reticulomyxa filosa]|eukprot:ETO02704.1 viral A-type inclusion protein [Reticulomyxa filosa]